MKTISILFCLLCFLGIQSQSIRISGKITGDGIALPGVNVTVEDKRTETFSDFNGQYFIEAQKNDVLVFKYVGFTTKKIVIKDVSLINVNLEIDEASLSEVVVIGYEAKTIDCHTPSRIIKKVSTPKASPIATEYESIEGELDEISDYEESASTTKVRSDGNDTKAGTLTAGEINDFNKWKLWNDTSQDDLRAHQETWKISPTKRFSVLIQNQNGVPVIGRSVHLINNKKDTLWSSITDNLGRAELWANMFKANNSTDSEKDYNSFTIAYNDKKNKTKEAIPFHKGMNHILIHENCNISNTIDAVFVVDATGSMSDEINYLKSELNDVINRVKKDNPDLTLNLGSVFYRDHKDAYLTRKTNLSNDISKTINFIKNQEANGGGDFPEAIDEALEVAIDGMDWNASSRTKMVFVVLDAPPHQSPENIKRMQSVTFKAAKKGIKIIPIVGSGIDKSTEYLMRSLALCTNGTYVFTTDHSGIGNPHLKPTTDSYEVEKLNDLLVRLFNQYTSVVGCDNNIQSIEKTISNSKKLSNSITKNSLPNSISLNCKFYPNPTSGILNIDVHGKIEELFMTDISGKILQRIAINDNNSITTDISSYPNGIYLMNYTGTDQKLFNNKIILNK